MKWNGRLIVRNIKFDIANLNTEEWIINVFDINQKCNVTCKVWNHKILKLKLNCTQLPKRTSSYLIISAMWYTIAFPQLKSLLLFSPSRLPLSPIFWMTHYLHFDSLISHLHNQLLLFYILIFLLWIFYLFCPVSFLNYLGILREKISEVCFCYLCKTSIIVISCHILAYSPQLPDIINKWYTSSQSFLVLDYNNLI